MHKMTPLGLTNSLQQDQATIARRKANAPLLATKQQQACDVGLFSDLADQMDLIEMWMDGANE